jgi:GT2 family glycosyltransferase/glycosyltransferase involved in cell wall biosynthesis
MKKRLTERLHPRTKRKLKRLLVSTVTKTSRVGARLLDVARANGIDIPKETGVGSTAEQFVSGLPQASISELLHLLEVVSENSDDKNSAKPPRCSIIIPVFNKAEYTFRCLCSLFAETEQFNAEIIIVDNGSTDLTPRLFSHLKGRVKVLQNSENEGFVKACNQGAVAALGEYLVFLNNDTIVEQGWLKELVETAEADPTVGAVGSMLVYPDGRLQEAGGIVWSDGKAANYGRGGSPNDRRFNFAREVDYCSAASLLVKKAVFEKLGGFDERYAPAYYEDTDLCMGIRSLGMKVIYQPFSRVIHFEGATAGTDLTQGFKRFQQVNSEKFFEKWHEVLASNHKTSDSSTTEIAADRRTGPRIIVFEHYVPMPDRDSGSVRMRMILKILSRYCSVTFVPELFKHERRYEIDLQKEGVEVLSPLEFEKSLKAKKFDVAIYSRAAVADMFLPSVRKLDKRIKIIFDTVDIQFQRFQREYELTGELETAKKAKRSRKQEVRLTNRSDEIWCVTNDDAAALRREATDPRITIIPNIHVVRRSVRRFVNRNGLLFVGSFSHKPNLDALRFYAIELLPRLRELLPEAKLTVVGSNMTDEVTALASESIEIAGFIPDIEPILDRARIFIAPLRYGSGMKGKIGLALSNGLPVVTTTIGAEGMGCQHGRELLIADEPADFALTIRNLYLDEGLWHRLSEAGIAHITANFTPEVIEPRLMDSVERIAYGS